ncbi:LOW QUALITY PROTEIN: uncharacterized protein AAEQ78_004359 [Lycaon pictus]
MAELPKGLQRAPGRAKEQLWGSSGRGSVLRELHNPGTGFQQCRPWSQGARVVEEHGIRKIIIVPQTIDYHHTTMPAPIQLSHFIAPISPMYPRGPQLMYPPAQREFTPLYIQEPVPQQLPPPLLPLPATFIYQEQHETYSHGRTNYNHCDERAANMGEHMKKKMREGQHGRHKSSYIVTNTSLLDKTNDFSSIPATPSTYTVDYAPSTYTVGNTTSTYAVDNVSCTYTVENALSTKTVENTLCTFTVNNAPSTYTVNNAQNSYIDDNTLSIYTVDNPSSTYLADNTPSISSTDHTPSTFTTDSGLPSTTDSVPNPSGTNYVPKTSTYDSTPRPSPVDSTSSSSISDCASSTPISESVPSTSAIDGALSASSAASNPNTASAQVEISHGNKGSAAGSGYIKQKTGGKQSKAGWKVGSWAVSPAPCAPRPALLGSRSRPHSRLSEEPPPEPLGAAPGSMLSDIQTRSAIISWKLLGSEKCDHNKSPVTFDLEISNSGKNGKYKNVYVYVSLYSFLTSHNSIQICYLNV